MIAYILILYLVIRHHEPWFVVALAITAVAVELINAIINAIVSRIDVEVVKGDQNESEWEE